MKNLIFISFFLFSTLFSYQNSIDDTIRTKKEIFPSSLIPGYGQLLNGKILKSMIIITAEFYMISKFNKHRIAFNDLNESSDNSLYLYHLNNRNKFAWYTFFVYVYSILDSTVDYHMDDLKTIFIEEKK